MKDTTNRMQELFKQKQKIEAEVDKWSEKLNNHTPDKLLNLLSDKIRMSESYKQEKRGFDISFLQLKRFNQSLTKKEKKQLRDMKRGEQL